MICMDQAGYLPIVSSQGHKCIMCLFKVDGNYIAFKPMRSCDKAEMIWVYNRLIKQLQKQGVKLKKAILDNETSKKYLKAIKENALNGN